MGASSDLTAPVKGYWTVAGVLGHIAYWDIRVLVVADKIDRGERRGEHLDEIEAELRTRG